MHKDYRIEIEVAGNKALWTDPCSTTGAPISYVAPTYSAVKGIFESVFFSSWTEVIPEQCIICNPISFIQYNINSPYLNYRKDEYSSYQMKMQILTDVRYVLTARLLHIPNTNNKTTNGAHAYHYRFNKMIKRGQNFREPCLGLKEFSVDYIGKVREDCTASKINLTIPSMLKTPFRDGRNSKPNPYFYQNVKIINGVLKYA